MQGTGAIVAARLPCVRMSTWVNCPIALENVLADKGVHVRCFEIRGCQWAGLRLLGGSVNPRASICWLVPRFDMRRSLKTYWRIGATRFGS